MPRSNYDTPEIALPAGCYRVYGFVPMTGLMLDKWITVTRANSVGCYGPADIEIATVIPNLLRIEDADGRTVWPREGA